MSEPVDIPQQLAALMDLAPAGFAIALHVRFTSPLYLFQTYPDDWLAEYSRDGLVMRDPTVAWGFAHVGTTDWAALGGPAEPDGVMARAAAHGLRHGITVSLLRDGSRSLASFARSDRPFDAEEVAAIEEAAVALHDATASAQPLSADSREAIRRLSVAFTHP